MKMVKSLLLGSAAGFVAIAGAQAADLPVKAKAVQYVKICSLYGDGYYYIPGSETCLKLGGYVRADYGYNVRGARTANYSGAGGAQDRTVSDYSTRHRGNIQIDTRTQTAYGTVRTFESLHVSDQDQATIDVKIARAFIQFAGFTFGHTKSFTDTFGLGDNYTLQQVQNQSDSGANGVNQIAYTTEFGNGVSLTVGADETRTKSIINFGNAGVLKVGAEPANSHKGEGFPDPYLAFKIEQAWGYWMASLVGHDNSATYYGATTTTGHPGNIMGWGILTGGELKLPWIGPGDRIGYYFNYGVGTTAYTGGSNLASPALFGSGNNLAVAWVSDGVYANNGGGIELTTAWTLAAGYEHPWSSTLKTSIYGAYTQVSYNATAKNYFSLALGCTVPIAGTGVTLQTAGAFTPTNCDPNLKFWNVGTRTLWNPVPGLNLGLDVFYYRVQTAFNGTATGLVPTANSARPTGTYSLNDQGIWAAVFRAQRNFGAGD
jgi:hypothetical protein